MTMVSVYIDNSVNMAYACYINDNIDCTPPSRTFSQGSHVASVLGNLEEFRLEQILCCGHAFISFILVYIL